jgi:hypothetical protein
VQRAPGIPHALMGRKDSGTNSGASRGGNAEACSLMSSLPATNAKRLRKGANGSRECAPDDRLRDESIHLSSRLYGLLRFSRNDGSAI